MDSANVRPALRALGPVVVKDILQDAARAELVIAPPERRARSSEADITKTNSALWGCHCRSPCLLMSGAI